MGRLISAVAVVLAGGVLWALPGEDDQPINTAEPRARQAIAVAQEIVHGSVVDVSRDSDNGKWEVTVRQGGHEYEVELAPKDLGLLRVDYD